MDTAERSCTLPKHQMLSILITEQFNLHMSMKGGLLMALPLPRLERLRYKKNPSRCLRYRKEARVRVAVIDLILKVGSYFDVKKSFGKINQ